MSVLVALIREAQPGRVAEVRKALQEQAAITTQRFAGIRSHQLLQGRAQTNLYVDLGEWESRRAFESARDELRSFSEEIRPLFLRPARVRIYRPLQSVRMHRRQPEAAGVGLVRVRLGHEQTYADHMREWVGIRFKERPGLIAAGIYQGEDEPQQFLIRNTWDTEENLIAHRNWMTREMMPISDPWIARREVLALLMRWQYRPQPVASLEII